MTLFSYSFHLDCVLRIWDAIFAYGLGFMVNIALGMVSYIRHDLMGKTLGDILEYMPELKEMYVDVDTVLFNSSNFKVTEIDIDLESEVGSETIQDELDEDQPIQTNWNSLQNSHHHSKSLIEEFSISSVTNLSKFSV